MRRILKSVSFKIFAAVLAALVAGSVISAFSHSGKSPFASAVSVVFGPVQKLGASIADKMADLPFTFRSSTQLKNEIDSLNGEIEELKSKIVDYDEIKSQNELYAKFYGLKQDNPDQEYCEASVIGRDAGDFLKSFTLNKGTTDGVAVNDPVIFGNNLVGVVASVSPTSCTVNTVMNPAMNVRCYESRTRIAGYSTTTVEFAEQGLCLMPDLPVDTPMTTGGIVCTSGLGGFYPEGLIIGTVDSIVDATVNISAYALIKPAVDVNSITDVFIITAFDGQGTEN